MLEKHFRTKVIKELKEVYGCFVVKVEGLSNGMPDLILSYNGRFTGLELKGQGKYGITPAQELTLINMRKTGALVFVLKWRQEWKDDLKAFMSGDKHFELNVVDWDNM